MFEAAGLAGERSGRIVFDAVSFRLAPGGALLLTGPNGAGKTSLLRALAGLGRLVAGSLTWDGAPALEDPVAHAGRISFVGHQDALKPALTVRQALRHEAALRGGEPEAAMTALGAAHLADHPIRILSAGQRRRVALARLALAPRPLWLLDEPTVALDSAGVARLGNLLARHRATGGMVIASSHLPLPLDSPSVLDLSPAFADAA